MIKGLAHFRGAEVEVDFSATGTITDYGVDRSPEFIEWSNFEVESLSILGVEVEIANLPKDLVEAIHDLHGEVEFEVDE